MAGAGIFILAVIGPIVVRICLAYIDSEAFAYWGRRRQDMLERLRCMNRLTTEQKTMADWRARPYRILKAGVVQKTPWLPLVMECPRNGGTFRLGVNSKAWKDEELGVVKPGEAKTRCPVCGDWHTYTKENTRAVSFEEARKLPGF